LTRLSPGTKVAPFPSLSSPDNFENLSPSPYPYIEMRMVMMPKKGMANHARVIWPASSISRRGPLPTLGSSYF
jgi:hypothetical protein